METVKVKHRNNPAFAADNGGVNPSISRSSVSSKHDRWIRSLEDLLEHVLEDQGPDKANLLLENVVSHLREAGINVPRAVSTPYANTIPADQEPQYPGNRELERR